MDYMQPSFLSTTTGLHSHKLFRNYIQKACPRYDHPYRWILKYIYTYFILHSLQYVERFVSLNNINHNSPTYFYTLSVNTEWKRTIEANSPVGVTKRVLGHALVGSEVCWVHGAYEQGHAHLVTVLRTWRLVFSTWKKNKRWMFSAVFTLSHTKLTDKHSWVVKKKSEWWASSYLEKATATELLVYCENSCDAIRTTSHPVPEIPGSTDSANSINTVCLWKVLKIIDDVYNNN